MITAYRYGSIIIEANDIDGPIISNIVHSANVTETDLVNITCTVTDASGIQSVTLYYRINEDTWITLTMTLISGNTYGATIGTFAAGDIIEYYILAVDDSPNHNTRLNDNNELYFSFEVQSIPPTETTSLLFSLTLVAILALALIKRRKL